MKLNELTEKLKDVKIDVNGFLLPIERIDETENGFVIVTSASSLIRRFDNEESTGKDNR